MADLRQQLISKYISPAQSQGQSFTDETDEPDLRQGLIDKYLSEGARRAYEEEKQAAIGDIRSRVGSLEDRWKKEFENTQWRSQQDTAGFRADFTRERRALDEDIRRVQYKFGRADGALSKDLDFVRGDLERHETDLDKYQQYWGQWNSRDMYDNYTLGEQNKVLQKYASEQAAKARSDYEQYLEDPAYLVRQKEYAPIPYAQRSSGIAPEREPFETTEEGKRASELKSKMDYWDLAVQQSQDESIRIRDMEEFYTWPEEDQKALREYADHRASGAGTILGQSPWQFYLSNHKGAELAEKYGSEKLESIAESFTRTQNQDAAQQIAEKTREWTEKIPGAVGHSALSIGASVAGAVTGPMGYLGEAFNRTDRYSTLDPNNAGTVFGKYSGGVRGNVSENLREQGPFGKIADMIYQGGMSAMDSLARLAVGGEAGSLALAATGSFADTVSDASSRGATPWEATLMGIADGGLEVLTEKVSLDNLLSDIAESPRNFWQILKSAAIQGGVEVSEEELSFLGSLAAEAVILRENSAYEQRIAELMVEENKTQQEALEIADRELWHEAVNTALVSFVSGDFMSTVAQTGTAIYNRTHSHQENTDAPAEEGPLTSEEYKGILEQLQEPTPEQVEEEDMEIVNALHRAAYDKAFGIGQTGLDASYMEGIEHLTPEEKTEAYRQGAADAQETAIHMQQKNDSLVNGKTGYKKGTVKGEGVTIQDLRTTFNDTQNQAFKILSTYAEATGINIVLYKSAVDEKGNFQGAQGRFHRNDDTIYIDIHAGLKNVSSVNDLAKYTMVRTFGHEFTHFVEKWNPTEYNGFRKTVFAALEAKGENPMDLIEQKQAGNEGMSFDQASREVIAEAMTDILPDSHFVEQLAAKNQTVFQQIKAKLHEFVAHLKEYFNSLGHNRSREANALKVQIGDSLHYMEDIVKAFDSVAVGAVESYQSANAVDEVTETVTETSETAVEKAENATESHEAEQETAETTQDNHTSEQENAAQEEAAAPQSEPRTFSSDNGYTVSENMEYGSWEIAFDGKPSEAVRAALKEHKFRWHRGKKVWYGKGDPETIMKDLDAAYYVGKESVGTEEGSPVAEPATIEKKHPVKPDTDPIIVYRGYNASDDPRQKNLARIRSVSDVVGTNTAPEFELLPVSFFTESEDDARVYSEFDKKLMEEFKKRAVIEYRGRIIDGKASASEKSPEAQKWIDQKAMDTFKILYGRRPSEPGKVIRYNIYPQNTLDLTSLGEKTSVDAIYGKLSAITGLSEIKIDDELILSDLNEFTDDQNVPVYALLKNGKGTDLGSRFYKFMSQNGYDTFKYVEDGVNHYAITDRVYTEEAPDISEIETTEPKDDPIESKTAQTENMKEQTTFEKLSIKKDDWLARDIVWTAPGRKTPIAYSTVATMNMIEALCEDNPTATVSELLSKVGYDQETKRVLHQFIAFGYGKENAKEFFGKNLRNDPNSEYTYRNPAAESIIPQQSGTPSEKAAYRILNDYLKAGKVLAAKDLYQISEEAFGGTQAEGAYNRKDAYDAMELAVNQYIAGSMADYNGTTAAEAVEGLRKMQSILDLLPTQSVRTEEQLQYQQFSTPPNIAYTAAWLANINSQDQVLEPSAGIGGLASFAKAWGADVAVNELSERRLGVLRSMGFQHVFNENAEQIDNVLPDSIQPSVVLMNPPFSSTAGRTAHNKTSNAERHIDQALSRLQEGGRLVAILGKGMNNADYAKYWNQVRKEYNIRANLSIDGSNFKKYGTTWGIQIVVIDKTGPQMGETVTGNFTDLSEVPAVMEGIRNDRTAVERNGHGRSSDSIRESVSYGGNRQSDTGHKGSGEHPARAPAPDQSAEDRTGSQNPGKRKRPDSGSEFSEVDGQQETAPQRGSAGQDGRTDPGESHGVSGTDRSSGPESKLSPDLKQELVSDDGVYATFVVPEVPVKGGKKHPAVLVESAAMAAVPMPKATYTPQLPAEVVKNNLSDAQMVTVTYAGQAHSQQLPDGRRRGFFIGDGTGVGKGRQIAGIILDNFMQGRKKAVWISKNNDLFGDAIRDWTATTGRSKDEVISQSKINVKKAISLQEGILFSTYDTLKSERSGSRLEQIVTWLGEDFDGVIAFDEAHNMGNLFGKHGKFGKSVGSDKAKAGVELQRRLPNARIVYVSATGATEVENLAYAERLGLWGQGTAFHDAKDFISKIGSSGLAAMELVVRDLKAMGSYVARSISYNGVNYDTVEHPLNPMQTEIYNTMSRAWQKTMQDVQAALESTGGNNNSAARQKAMGQYYSAMQRFYNQVLTSMSMPSVIADMRKELAAGRSCVLQVVNTNEAQQNKQLAAAKADGTSLDDLDLTPREALVGYLRNSFPVQMYEEYTDDDGNIRSRLVVDSKGEPVLDRKAVRQRDALIEEINQMSIPDGPLEMLFDAFGTENVAENTGRSRRVVPKKMADGSVSRVEESRRPDHRTADVQAFQDGKKRILIFSDAGGTGKSYHADRSEKNQQQRVHYVLQPGWVASNAVQGFGRTHRSNEASAPIYKLVTTNIKGQKRFTSTIARRLDQLGALTKGQRDTGSGMFGAKDNLETDLAKDSLREFYTRLGKNQLEDIDGMTILDKLGLKKKFSDEYGNFKINESLSRDISTFLNRILALEVDEQNQVFDAFISIYEMELEAAIQAGTLDTGMENVKADKVEILDDKVIRQDENSGASTHYIQAKTYKKPTVIATVEEMSKRRAGFVGIYKTESGAVKAVFRIADKTTDWGAVRKQYRLIGPNQGAKTSVWNEDSLKNKAVEIPRTDWQKEWDAEVSRVPKYNEETLHMLTGALLPIWNSLPQEGNTRVKRLISSDGSIYLGRVIGNDMIDSVLRGFSVGRTHEKFTSQQVMDKALRQGTRFQLTNDRAEIFRSRVSGEWRLELKQQNGWYLKRNYPGLIQERIQYVDRYFIPTGDNGIQILDKLLKDNPVRNTSAETEDQFQQRTDTLTDREVLETAANDLQLDHLTESERATLDIFQARLGRLRDLEEQRKELGTLYREQQLGANGVKVDRAAAEKTREQMAVMDKQIQRANADVLSVEDKQVLKQVLHKARKIVEQEERQHGDEKLKRWRDRRNNAASIKKYRTRVMKDVSDMTKWVTQPDNKDVVKHIPDALKTSVLPFLSSIDMTSKRSLRGGDPTKADQEFAKRLEAMQKALQSVNREEDLYSGFYDLPVNFQEKLQNLVHTVQELVKNQPEAFVLNQMTSAELKDLSDVVRAVKKLVQDCNRLHNNAMFAHVYEAGDNTISALGAMSDAPSKSRVGQTANKFLFWQQIRPAYAWERFGEGGKAIFDGLRKGQAQLAFDANSIMEYSEKSYRDEEVKAWEKEVKTIDLDGETVKIPVSHIMSFYCLSHRKHALNHIISQAGGIRVATFRNGKQVTADTGHRLTIEDVETIIGELTPRQMEVADKLQQYMARVGGKWRNEINFVRFGEEAPIDETYFPISSDGRHLESSADENPSAASLYALLNMSFNKPLTEGANNRIVLYSIFDVFANHMSSMAQYHSMALPVLDALKWFNYRQTEYVEREMEDGTVKTEKKTVDSVRDEMSRVYGTPEENRPGSGKRGYAETFVLNILKAFNGTEAQGTPMDTMGLKFLHLYNGAQISYNLRVVMQQPLAIFRAGTILDQSTILRSLAASPQAVAADAKEMVQYSGIAAWKVLGFYDVNISRGLTATIKHDESVKDKVMDFGLKGAEKADEITWAAIWRACKLQVAKDGTRPGSAQFFPKVEALFEEVIYKTQVVDSILTKNEFLRDKGGIARTLGSFMAEPTTTASMFLDAYDKYQTDVRRGLSRRTAFTRNKKMIVRTAYTYGASAIILAAVQAVADGWRDDDDYETMPEKWWEAFVGNFVDELMPFNKLPIISDLYELSKELLHRGFGMDTYGNPPRSFYMQWYDILVKGVEILHDKITGDDSNYTWYGGAYKLLQTASGIVGLPMAAATREIVTGWNNTVGALAPSLKIKTYDSGAMNNIKYAYMDGYLTSEEAAAELLKERPTVDEDSNKVQKSLVEDENAAYWKIKEWDAPGGEFSRYDALFTAMQTGRGFDAAMAELTEHGYKQKDVLSQAKSQIGKWYQEGEIGKQQATAMLSKHFDLDADEITGLVNKWSCEVETGIKYEEIKPEYLEGNIGQARAIELRTRYGGESKEDATETVQKWGAEKNTGVAYEDIKESFMDGDITADKARDMYVKYGGLSADEAEEKIVVMSFVKEHPDCKDITYAAVEDYETYCEDAGVPAKVFYDTWKYNSKTHADLDENGKTISGSKKVKILDYINGLNLSSYQKDSLYFTFGWAESKLHEAPWH